MNSYKPKIVFCKEYIFVKKTSIIEELLFIKMFNRMCDIIMILWINFKGGVSLRKILKKIQDRDKKILIK